MSGFLRYTLLAETDPERFVRASATEVVHLKLTVFLKDVSFHQSEIRTSLFNMVLVSKLTFILLLKYFIEVYDIVVVVGGVSSGVVYVVVVVAVPSWLL